MTAATDALHELLATVRSKADAAGVFGGAELRDGVVLCAAHNAAEPAFYRVEEIDGKLWVSLVTDNRWLSESIESDLVHTGDKLEELIEEEMVDLGYDGPPLPFEHFRSDDLLFTFRSPLPVNLESPSETDADTVALALLGYEACFRQLGDMDDSGEDD
ncbi:MAG: hypothetical protein AAGG07_11640 [Planctomycetota bacterium]